MVFIGKAGADWGIRGETMAFKASDGTKVWGFELIPTGRQLGADTWKRPGTAKTGGGSTWTTYSPVPVRHRRRDCGGGGDLSGKRPAVRRGGVRELSAHELAYDRQPYAVHLRPLSGGSSWAQRPARHGSIGLKSMAA